MSCVVSWLSLASKVELEESDAIAVGIGARGRGVTSQSEEDPTLAGRCCGAMQLLNLGLSGWLDLSFHLSDCFETVDVDAGVGPHRTDADVSET